MADEEDRASVEGQRVVHRELLGPLRLPRGLGVGHVGGELGGHARLLAAAEELHAEVVDGEVERLEVVGPEERGAKSSYWLSELENPCPFTTITPPV